MPKPNHCSAADLTVQKGIFEFWSCMQQGTVLYCVQDGASNEVRDLVLGAYHAWVMSAESHYLRLQRNHRGTLDVCLHRSILFWLQTSHKVSDLTPGAHLKWVMSAKFHCLRAQ